MLGKYLIYDFLHDSLFPNIKCLLDYELSKDYGDELSSISNLRYKPIYQNVVIKNHDTFKESFFDIYTLILNPEYKAKLCEEIETKIQKILSNYSAEIPNLTISIVDDIKLSKKHYLMIENDEIELVPQVSLEYGTTQTNIYKPHFNDDFNVKNNDEFVEVITSLDVKISVIVNEIEKIHKGIFFFDKFVFW